MTEIPALGEVNASNSLIAFQESKGVKENTEAQSMDAIQSKDEAHDGQNVKNNLQEKGVGANIDIFI